MKSGKREDVLWRIRLKFSLVKKRTRDVTSFRREPNGLGRSINGQPANRGANMPEMSSDHDLAPSWVLLAVISRFLGGNFCPLGEFALGKKPAFYDGMHRENDYPRFAKKTTTSSEKSASLTGIATNPLTESTFCAIVADEAIDTFCPHSHCGDFAAFVEYTDEARTKKRNERVAFRQHISWLLT